MYQYILNICVFSVSDNLQNALKNLPPYEGFEYRVYFFSELTEDAAAQSDILIYDFPWTEDAQALIDRCKKPKAYSVLCVQHMDLREEFFADGKWTGIWQKPLTESMTQFLLRSLLQQLHMELSCALNGICLETLIDSIPDLVWFKDLKGAHYLVNKKFCDTVGKTKEQVWGRGHYYIWDISPEEYSQGEYVCLETEEAVLKAKQTCLFDEQVKCRDGMRQFKTYKSPILDVQNKIIGTVGVARDVTDIGNIKAELDFVLDLLPFPVLMQNVEGVISSVNKRFAECLGSSGQCLLNKEYSGVMQQYFTKHTEMNEVGGVGGFLTANNSGSIYEVQQEPVKDIFGKLMGYLSVFRDVTLEHKYQQKILLLANTDPLTGIYNRRFCMEKLQQYLREKEEFSLVSIDLDNLKLVNDSLGHEAGDDYIMSVVNVFVAETFERDVLCRIGGDEFIFVMFRCNEEQAQAKMHKIQSKIEALQKPFALGISYGISSVSAGEKILADELITVTDLKMYQMKKRREKEAML